MGGDGSPYTPKGLLLESEWGSLRNAALVAHAALRAALLVDAPAVDYTQPEAEVAWAHHVRCFARQQMNYIYGSTGHCFITDWGVRPP
eukprot:jgi/Ulvmu1/11718/UM008_0129.1